MLVFKNDGELDVRAIKTFGVSSKDNPDTAIGFFGTGLKYAIAVCLREGLKIRIYTGGRRYDFNTTKQKIRNDEFEIVTMNNEELGFTTELGKTWELWMAYRELRCNAMDESGEVYITSDELGWATGKSNTYVDVVGEAMEHIHNNRAKFFLENRKQIATDKSVTELYKKEEAGPATFFYRGVRVGESLGPALYDYNFLNALDITEDRTIKHAFQPAWNMQALFQAAPEKRVSKKILRTVLCAHPDSLEGQINWRASCRAFISHSEYWLDTVGELREELKDVGISPSAVAVHMEARCANILPTESCELNQVQKIQLSKARNFCKEALELDIDKFNLLVVSDLGKGQLGRTDRDTQTMYLSKKVFEQGTKRVACALLEEYTHLEHKVEDETIQQKWVYLEQILSLGERILGEPL